MSYSLESRAGGRRGLSDPRSILTNMQSTWETCPSCAGWWNWSDETNAYVSADALAIATGLDEAQVQRAIGALAREEPPFFEVIDATTGGGTYYMGAVNSTGHARRTVGAWPTPESLTDRIVAALSDVAGNAPTEEERSRAKKTLDVVGGVGKSVLTSVLTKVVVEGM